MHRFYADSSRSDESVFWLEEEDKRHAEKVLRLRPGDRAEILFHDTWFLSEMISSGAGGISFFPVNKLPSTEPSVSVTLFQGLPKGDKMDLIVQKAVELGAVRIVPVSFSRCVVRLNGSEASRKRDRWQKIAREAAKQCGRCRITEVTGPVNVTELPKMLEACEAVAFPWEECPGGGPLSFFRRHPDISSLGIVIGPEGGITKEEANALSKAGCETITLGKRILRTETAGLASISAFMALYGEME